MLIKLLKHDFISLMKKLLGIWLILGVIFGIQLLLAEDVEPNVFNPESFPEYSELTVIALLIGIMVVTLFLFSGFVASLPWFNRKMFSDEGYLTHTLPVKTSQIVLSKVIVAFIAGAIGVLLGMFAAYIIAEKYLFVPFNFISRLLSLSIGEEAFRIFIRTIIVTIFNGFTFLSLGFFSITLASVIEWGYRAINTAVIFLILYTANSILLNKFVENGTGGVFSIASESEVLLNSEFLINIGIKAAVTILVLGLTTVICSRKLKLN